MIIVLYHILYNLQFNMININFAIASTIWKTPYKSLWYLPLPFAQAQLFVVGCFQTFYCDGEKWRKIPQVGFLPSRVKFGRYIAKGYVISYYSFRSNMCLRLGVFALFVATMKSGKNPKLGKFSSSGVKLRRKFGRHLAKGYIISPYPFHSNIYLQCGVSTFSSQRKKVEKKSLSWEIFGHRQ